MRSLELGSPGEMRSRLNGLVVEGRKRATAGLVEEYEQEGEAFEHVGERLVLLHDDGTPAGTVEVTSVERTTFGEVPWELRSRRGRGTATSSTGERVTAGSGPRRVARSTTTRPC